MAATTGYVGAGLPATDHSPAHDRASSRPLRVLPGLPARDAKDAVAPDPHEHPAKARMAEKPARDRIARSCPANWSVIWRNQFPHSSGAPSQPEQGENHLANINRRTYPSKHLAWDCVAGSVRESSYDRRWSSSLLSRPGSRRLLLRHVLRAGSILHAGQRLSRR